MLQLYFWPMACSLASRIALMEAGIEAHYHVVDIFKKKLAAGGGDFREVSPKGAVPVLVLEDGQKLTENMAVLQYIADLKPQARLVPAPGSLDRYRLHEWLSFTATEIHKGFLFPVFWYPDEPTKPAARERVGQSLSVAARRLDQRPWLVGDNFTVADAYFAWSLMLVNRGGVDVAAWPQLVRYLDRVRERPHVKAAIETEMTMRKAMQR
jgi:glutathione S-transferase